MPNGALPEITPEYQQTLLGEEAATGAGGSDPSEIESIDAPPQQQDNDSGAWQQVISLSVLLLVSGLAAAWV